MRRAVAKRNANSGEWKPIKSLTGVTYLTLNKDDETHGVTRLTKFSKGYEVEKSLHDGLVELFVLEEIRDQLHEAGLQGLRCELVSDRHWAAWGRLPKGGA